MYHFKIYVTLILINASLSFGTKGELINDTNNAQLMDNVKPKIPPCCTNGSYDFDTNTCVGKNHEKFPFALPCMNLTHFDDLELDLEPEFIENICETRIYKLDDRSKQGNTYFICEMIEECCTSGKFNLKTRTCDEVMPTTAKHAFSFACQEFRPFEDPESVSGFFSVEPEKTCVAKVPSSSEEHAVAYITCKKIDQELQLTFEIWLFPVSIVFLVITLYIYLTELKELRSPQDVAFIFSMYCLLFHMILFMIRYSNGNKNASITIFYNYVGRYFKTAYFSWFNIMLISRLIENRNLTHYFPFSINLRSIWNHFYAWTTPLIFIIIYFYYPVLNWHIPILILWIINVILLIMIICSVEYDKKFELLIWKRNHYRSWLLVRLFLGSGAIWVFGARYRIPIFTSIFALQGVLIFLLMVVYRYNAKRKLGGQKFGCFTFPERWKNLPEIDVDDVPVDQVYEPVGEDDKFVFRIPIDM